MGMSLAHGGHLTHGSPVNISGKYFSVIDYGVDEEKERIKTHGVILLGPIPIIFSSEKRIPKFLIGLVITCLIIFLVISIYFLLLLTGVSL